MKSTDLLKQMTQAGENIINVDLTGAHGDMMAEIMQTADGDDFWKEHYEMLLKNVRDGVYPTTTDFKTLLQYTEGTDGLTDSIIPFAAAEEGAKSLGVDFSYSFVENVAELYWTVMIPSLGVASYGGMAPVCRNTEELHWDLQEEVTETEGFLQVTWRCMEDDMVKSQVQRFSIIPTADVQADWIVSDPVKKISKYPSFILVVYGREAKGAEKADYEYQQKNVPEEGLQELFLDCKGSITFGEKILTAFSNGVTVMTEHGGAASAGFELTPDGNGLTFHQPKDWETTVPTKKFSLTDKAYLSLTIAVQFENGEYATLRLNSTDSDWAPQKENHAYWGSGKELRIPTLRLVWGCVAEDTQITMADGTSRQISELKQGDWIISGDGSEAEIATVYSGPEKELYVLELADGTKLRASNTHPVRTAAGFVSMNHIMVGDSVQMRDGSMQQVISVKTEEYSGKVYNLQLYGEKRNMYCNGILAGDFITENTRNAAEKILECIGMNGGENGRTQCHDIPIYTKAQSACHR